jgi:hypothetical protein
MHIDAGDLFQDCFSTVYTCDAGARILLLNDEAPGEKIDDSVFDIARRNAGNRPD